MGILFTFMLHGDIFFDNQDSIILLPLRSDIM